MGTPLGMPIYDYVNNFPFPKINVRGYPYNRTCSKGKTKLTPH